MTPEAVAGGSGIAVLIVAYNDVAVLERCLASLAAQSLGGLRIFLVDNSTTDAVERAFSGRPGIAYRRNAENLGFCGANNVGIRMALEAGCRWVLFLNHDTELDPDCVSRLAAAAGAPGGPFLAAPKIRLLPERDRLWYGGGWFDRRIGAGKNRGFNAPDDGGYDAPGEVTYATGCCLLIPAEAFRRAGLLNERMFMYLDDIEFCLRTAREGYRIRYEPSAVVYHELGSGSELRKRPGYYLYFSIRNKPLVAPGGWYGAYLHSLALLFAAVKMVQFAIVPGIPARGEKLRALAWGAWDSLSGQERYRRRFPGLFRR